ncbi:YciI family protein [Pendulispora albinea]|uniref:YciI family protein n=1 Tax=Pendulispora albinea TaxID=2741071 RepID=A0ABZ2LMG3_9BACT
MLYSILIYGSQDDVAAMSTEEDDAIVAQHVALQQPLLAAGKLGPVARLTDPADAKTYRPGREPLVMDGPFAETKEQLLGLYVVDCGTLDEAIDLARSMPTLASTCFEVRPVSWFEPGSVGART